MLKKTVTMLVVVAGLAALALVPSVSAHTLVAARTTSASCPPGNSNSANYCEPHCVVPTLVGYSLSQSDRRLKEANCKLGHIYLVLKSKDQPPLTARFYPLFTVTKQSPSPGTILRDGAKVDVYVRFH